MEPVKVLELSYGYVYYIVSHDRLVQMIIFELGDKKKATAWLTVCVRVFFTLFVSPVFTRIVAGTAPPPKKRHTFPSTVLV